MSSHDEFSNFWRFALFWLKINSFDDKDYHDDEDDQDDGGDAVDDGVGGGGVGGGDDNDDDHYDDGDLDDSSQLISEYEPMIWLVEENRLLRFANPAFWKTRIRRIADHCSLNLNIAHK